MCSVNHPFIKYCCVMKYFILLILSSLVCSSKIYSQQLNPRSGNSLGIDNVVIGIVAPNNDIWLGSSTLGCAHFVDATNTWKFFNKDSARTNLKSNSITGIEIFSGNKTLCVSGSGAVATNSGTWPVLNEVVGSGILASASKLDTAWLVTSNKLFRYKYDGSSNFTNEINKSIVFPGSVTVIAPTGNVCGGFWGGTSATGCFYVEKDTISRVLSTLSPKSLVDNRVNDMAVEPNCSNLFVGTTGGFSVCSLDLTTPCQNYTTANGLPQNHIEELTIGCGGNVWLATKDSGIVVFNLVSKQFTRITKTNGLTDNRVSMLAISPNCNAVAFTADRNINILDSGKKVIKVITNIQESLTDKYIVSIYPNPTENHVLFEFEEELKHINLKIYDVNGRLVIEKEDRNTRSFQVDLIDLPKGSYLYNIIADKSELKSGKLELR